MPSEIHPHSRRLHSLPELASVARLCQKCLGANGRGKSGSDYPRGGRGTRGDISHPGANRLELSDPRIRLALSPDRSHVSSRSCADPIQMARSRSRSCASARFETERCGKCEVDERNSAGTSRKSCSGISKICGRSAGTSSGEKCSTERRRQFSPSRPTHGRQAKQDRRSPNPYRRVLTGSCLASTAGLPIAAAEVRKASLRP